MKKVYYLLLLNGLLGICPVLIALALYYSRLEKTSYNFERKINGKILGIRKFKLLYNSFYIAGATGPYLYLASYKSSGPIIGINTNLRDTQNLKVDIGKEQLKKGTGNYRIMIDSTQFYFYNGVARSIFKGNTADWKARPTQGMIPYFQNMIPISNNSYVYKFVSSVTQENALRKECGSGKRIENNKLFEKQIDGLFCTAGEIAYHPTLHLFSYVYHYRNEILMIDTNLNLVRTIKTIDPIHKAQIKIGDIESDGKKILLSSTIVNAKIATWKNYLFILSKLMGKHEDEKFFKHSSVIDIYDVQKGKYLYTVYLPNYDKTSITQFRIHGGFIYTVSPMYLSRYQVILPKSN